LAADSSTDISNEYSDGAKMKSTLQDSDLADQYNRAFPIPKPDSFGVCNNYKSAHFKQDDSSECA